MIKQAEIHQKAREAGVRDQQIEKDYALKFPMNKYLIGSVKRLNM